MANFYLKIGREDCLPQSSSTLHPFSFPAWNARPVQRRIPPVAAHPPPPSTSSTSSQAPKLRRPRLNCQTAFPSNPQVAVKPRSGQLALPESCAGCRAGWCLYACTCIHAYIHTYKRCPPPLPPAPPPVPFPPCIPCNTRICCHD